MLSSPIYCIICVTIIITQRVVKLKLFSRNLGFDSTLFFGFFGLQLHFFPLQQFYSLPVGPVNRKSLVQSGRKIRRTGHEIYRDSLTSALRFQPPLSFRQHQSVVHKATKCIITLSQYVNLTYLQRKGYKLGITSSSSKRSSTSCKSSWINFSNSLYSSLTK